MTNRKYVTLKYINDRIRPGIIVEEVQPGIMRIWPYDGNTKDATVVINDLPLEQHFQLIEIDTQLPDIR